MNLNITPTNIDEDQTQRHIFLRAIVCRGIVTDFLIIVLPSILYFDLLLFLQSHMSRQVQPLNPEFNSPVAQIGAKDFTFLNVNEPQCIPHPCKIYIPSNVTDMD